MTIRYMAANEAADYLGISVNTIKGYVRDDRFPEPDVMVGRVRGWTKATIDAWQVARPGRGARTDLRR